MKYPNITVAELEKMLISFEVFFPSLQHTVVSQSPSITFLDLVSNLGGTLGVFLGASVLSLLETGEFLIAASTILLKRNGKNAIQDIKISV